MISIKRLLQIGLILASGIAMPSWAIMITSGPDNGTNVGGVDTLLAEDVGQGSEQGEEDWVNTTLTNLGYADGGSITWTIKTEDVAYYTTDAMDVFAFELESAPAYFLVKNRNRVALFENLLDIDWGVFDTAEFTADMNLPDNDGNFIISHVTEFNGSDQNPACWDCLASA